MSISRREILQASSTAFVTTSLLAGTAKAARARIPIGQIGTKHAHARGKMATMRKFAEDFEVVGVVEPDDRRWKAMQDTDTYRGVKRMTEEELLNVKGLQAVAVETEVRDLVGTASRCISAGVHVHLDKPAGESLSAFRKVLDEATRRKLTVQMGYMFRYNPGFQFLFKAVRAGWLGNVFEASTVMSKKVGKASRRQIGQYPGGTMFELGCHVIDALVAVLGKPEKVTPFTRRTRPDEDRLADNQLAVFEYPRATATVRSSVVEVDGGRRRQFVVCGDEGTIDIKPLETPRLLLTLERPRGDFGAVKQKEIKLPRLAGRYDGDFVDLARIIRGEKSTDYPPAHDLAVHESILRASGVPVG